MDLRGAAGAAVMACIAGIALLGCGPWQDSREQSDSGIEGQTVVDGGCTQSATPTPCANRPLTARITVFDQDNSRKVTSIKTSSDGNFRTSLPAGTYVLHATNTTGAPLPAAEDLSVTVSEHQFLTVEIVFDSGVR